ncbi:hypothetical protein [Streptomyces xanthii]|uniref:DUF4034 domain-containing protein n=1 Tax=Streptomyces xanthii TaxID=2768069 RepID=A0A7H1B6T7_9ACTN|nr:hypothetical protein [Streptomyces xanthii]QNS04442.1 hypothetical protein IAG42_12980 [Streptomyces xanthii]
MDRLFLIVGAIAAVVFVIRWITIQRNHDRGVGRIPDAEITAAATALGLIPVAEIDAESAMAPDPTAEAVKAAIKDGSWEEGARYLAAAGRDWQERDRRSSMLADEAVKDDGWLLAWRTARPGDADAALVHARSLVYLAWEIRGSKLARNTTREQFEGFHRVLGQAREAFAAAQADAGDDPCPYIAELPLAMGLGYANERFEALWAEVEKRDPHHLAAHRAALQYWCAKWQGSHELAEEFGRAAAAKGEPGQLLSAVVLDAYFEYEIAHGDLAPGTYYSRPEIVAATDAALADIAAAHAADPHDRRVPPVRHLVGSFLYWQNRYAEALEQFRAADGYAGTPPWSYHADPAREYVKVRDYCAAQVRRAATG